MNSLIETLEEKVNQLKVDYPKFENGNNSAGTRVRKVAQEIKVLAQEIRVDVTETKNKRKS